MWKLILAFVLFAALALWVVSKGGNQLDMGGEKHGAEVHESAPAASDAASMAPAASEVASAASN
ncbi:hypothetical protein [Ideonella oryzae]|uniref:Membrane protein insertase YidC n=1 Tax=Ideonella oryzae TaxID=2937441 RepID=A0ABT1BPT9_9BURK|nr:hypothetical protein [Ideonella oryzae]MCO5977427.1 hypothetical protein [Ideonella oryzae]